jgi:hypothetical protein
MILDPSMWPQILEEISKDLGAVGAALLQSDIRTDDIPLSGGVSDLFKAYFADGWSAGIFAPSVEFPWC